MVHDTRFDCGVYLGSYASGHALNCPVHQAQHKGQQAEVVAPFAGGGVQGRHAKDQHGDQDQLLRSKRALGKFRGLFNYRFRVVSSSVCMAFAAG